MEAGTAPSPARAVRFPRLAKVWAWIRHHALNVYAALAIAYLLIPVAIIILFSFNDTQSRFNFVWQGFTLRHWEQPFLVPDLTDAMIVSLQLAAASTLIATTLGTMIALALVRHEFIARKTANVLIVLPIATPEVVIGAALLSLFLTYTFVGLGFASLFIAHVMFSISFVVIVVRSRLIGFDRGLEEAAQDLGATPVTTFRTVTLPLIFPGIMAGALLAFALSLDDFVISNFNAGTTLTFPLWIFGAARIGLPPQVNIMATLLFAVTVFAMVLTVWQQRRAERMAAVRPDQEETGLAALASGRRPVAGTER
jgi:spermidine/putrescine transport system permease protein